MIRRDESGYSMVEVLVAIVILTIAIVPMFAMFDLGLRTASTNSNLDKARTLAEKQMELAQSVPYTTVVSASFPANPECVNQGQPNRTVTDCRDSAYENIEFSVEKTYLELGEESAGSVSLQTSTSDKGITQISVRVYRVGDSNPIFTTTGVVTE